MDKFEQKLISLGTRSVSVPDTDGFLGRLHEELRVREEAKKRILVTVTVIALAAITTLGLFETLNDRTSAEYWLAGESEFLPTIVEDEFYYDSTYVDESLIYEVMDYLVQEADFVGGDWDLLDDLDEHGIVSISEIIL